MNASARREVTVLFSDIRGYTRLTKILPAAKLRALVDEYLEAVLDIIKKNRGTVDKVMGDGMMVIFGYPRTQKQHAGHAIRAALRIQKRVAGLRHAWQKAAAGADLQVRIGIASGLVMIEEKLIGGHPEMRALGETVNLAARLEERAEPGSVLVSDRTRVLTEDQFAFTRVPELELKGFADALAAHVPALKKAGPAPAARTGRTTPTELPESDLTGASEPAKRTGPPGGAEHRAAPRRQVRLFVNCEAGTIQERHRCLDISESGAFIDTQQPYPVGTSLRFHASLPSGSELVPVRLESRVVRVSNEQPPVGNGVQFTSIQAESLSTIRLVVREIFGLTNLSRRLIQKKADGFKYILDTEPDRVTLRGRALPVSFARLGIENSALLARRLEHEFRRTRRYGSEFTCLAVCLYNLDKVGSDSVVAEALEQLALALDGVVRDTDELFYMNEMRFFVLAPETMADRAETQVQRISRQLNAFMHTFEHDLSSLEIDVGAFTFDGHNATTPEELIVRTLLAAVPRQAQAKK